MRVLCLAMVAATGLAGCAGPSLDRENALAGACQFKPCVCADDDAPVWQKPATAEIVWSDRGVPSCPPGFVLQRVNESK